MGIGVSDVYEFEVLMGVIEKFAIPPAFVGVRFFPEETVESENATWEEIRYSRGVAQYVDKDAPAKPIDHTTRRIRTARTARVAEEAALPKSYLLYEREAGTFDRSIIERKVTREQRNLWNRILRRREASAWQVLFEHKFEPTYGGIAEPVVFDVAATHKPTVLTSWADPAADIISDIETWKEIIAKDGEEDPVLMVVPPIIMRYMIKNQSIRDLMGDALKDEIRNTGRIRRLLELDIEVYGKGYVPDGGSWTPYVPQDKVLICTTPGSFGQYLLGPELLTIGENDMRTVYGRWSYAKVTDNPTRIRLFAGEDHLPVLTRPDNLLTATVIPS